jgi:hypothetical protein
MPPFSTFQSIALMTLLFSGCGVGMASAEEGNAAVFVVDSSKGTASSFDKNTPIPAGSELRVFASGPKGSTVIVGAFGENGLHGNLLPLAVEQTNDTETIQFPAPKLPTKLTFKSGTQSAELYVVVFPNENPVLESVVNEVKQIEAASAKGETDLVMLLALELKKKLANAIRESGAKEYRDGFSDSLADLLQEEPTAKAAVSRTGTISDDPTAPTPAATTEPSSKSLSDLKTNWREDSISLPLGLVAPGGIVHTITPTP